MPNYHNTNKLQISAPYHAIPKPLARQLGLRWDPLSRCWSGNVTAHGAYLLSQAGVPGLPVPVCGAAMASEAAQKALHGDFPDDMANHPRLMPFTHQRAAMAALCATDAIYLAHEMGTGKTFSIVGALDLLGDAAHRVLVIAPLSVLPVWRREVDRHGAVPRRVAILDQNSVAAKAKRLALEASLPDHLLAVVNYESAWRKPLVSLILDQQWDMVVLDESHRIKDRRSSAAKFCHSLAPMAFRRVCLTGTPMPNNPMELFSQMLFLDPSVFGHNYFEHQMRYAVLGGFENRQIVAHKNQREFFERWERVAHRVRSDDVLDLPEATHIDIECTLSAEASLLYSDLQDSLCVEIEAGEITITNALTELLRLQQLTGGNTTTDDKTSHRLDGAKRDALQELLSSLPHDEPVVVMCRFRADLAAVHEASVALGRESGELSGSRNDLASWQDGASTVLAVQIQSGGLGVDLSRARYCVYYSLGYSLGDYQQSLARIHRQGQTRPCFYYHLLARLHDGAPTVDHAIYRALGRKEHVVESVLKHFHRKEAA